MGGVARVRQLQPAAAAGAPNRVPQGGQRQVGLHLDMGRARAPAPEGADPAQRHRGRRRRERFELHRHILQQLRALFAEEGEGELQVLPVDGAALVDVLAQLFEAVAEGIGHRQGDEGADHGQVPASGGWLRIGGGALDPARGPRSTPDAASPCRARRLRAPALRSMIVDA